MYQHIQKNTFNSYIFYHPTILPLFSKVLIYNWQEVNDRISMLTKQKEVMNYQVSTHDSSELYRYKARKYLMGRSKRIILNGSSQIIYN